MSRENAEIVRSIFEAFPKTQERLRAGTFPIGPPLAENIVWDASGIGLPDMGDGVAHGYAGVRRFWMAWLSAWEDVSYEYEVFDAGASVLVVIDQQNTGSEIAVPLRYAQVWTFEDGEVVHWKYFSDQAAAFKAVGLEPGGGERIS